MAQVSLVLANGPGFPQGSVEHRYELELTLDAASQPDVQAWYEDPAPWRAQRIWPGEAVLDGDVQYDAEAGWSLRFFGAFGEAADAPSSGLIGAMGAVRPGAHVTIREPDGTEYAWRVVNVA